MGRKGNFLDNFCRFLGDPEGLTRDEIVDELEKEGIDIRPHFRIKQHIDCCGSNNVKELSEALEYLTDEYIGEGNCCHQTIMDLRDALITTWNTLNRIKAVRCNNCQEFWVSTLKEVERIVCPNCKQNQSLSIRE